MRNEPGLLVAKGCIQMCVATGAELAPSEEASEAAAESCSGAGCSWEVNGAVCGQVLLLSPCRAGMLCAVCGTLNHEGGSEKALETAVQ